MHFLYKSVKVCRPSQEGKIMSLLSHRIYYIIKVKSVNLCVCVWRQDDDKKIIAETDKPPESIVAVEQSEETKESEREDLIARFDRVVRGESDGNLQVRIDS